jgi:hypothetical protein
MTMIALSCLRSTKLAGPMRIQIARAILAQSCRLFRSATPGILYDPRGPSVPGDLKRGN